jgi:hypothetical protein
VSDSQKESRRRRIREEDIRQVKTRISFEEAVQMAKEQELKYAESESKDARMEEEIEIEEGQLVKAATPLASSQMEIEEAKTEEEELSTPEQEKAILEYLNSLKAKPVHQNKVVNQVYAKRILFNLCSKEADSTPKLFLQKHSIMPTHRARMCDWMVEVLSTYSPSAQTFFLALSILDRYFAKHAQPLPPTHLHSLGCVSMLIASKYEEVQPLKLSVLVEKIAHNKISVPEILKLEQEIMAAIDFRPWAPTPFEMFSNAVSLLDFRAILSPSQFQHFEATAHYLLKMCMYHYELVSSHSYFEIVLGTLVISLKTTQEALPAEKLDMLKMVEHSKEVLGITDDSAFDVATQIVFLAQNFNKIYPSLQNLAKFNSI